MVLNSKAMQGTLVRTQSGQRVGKLLSVDIDADTGRISMLHVNVSGFVPALLDQEALIAWSQVVSMSDKEVVVLDAVVMEKARSMAQLFSTTRTPEVS